MENCNASPSNNFLRSEKFLCPEAVPGCPGRGWKAERHFFSLPPIELLKINRWLEHNSLEVDASDHGFLSFHGKLAVGSFRRSSNSGRFLKPAETNQSSLSEWNPKIKVGTLFSLLNM